MKISGTSVCVYVCVGGMCDSCVFICLYSNCNRTGGCCVSEEQIRPVLSWFWSCSTVFTVVTEAWTSRGVDACAQRHRPDVAEPAEVR